MENPWFYFEIFDTISHWNEEMQWTLFQIVYIHILLSAHTHTQALLCCRTPFAPSTYNQDTVCDSLSSIWAVCKCGNSYAFCYIVSVCVAVRSSAPKLSTKLYFTHSQRSQNAASANSRNGKDLPVGIIVENGILCSNFITVNLRRTGRRCF